LKTSRKEIVELPYSFAANNYFAHKYRRELYPIWPKTLSHYTDVDGLKGILETGSLWATNVGFLNDSSEFRYGVELCQEISTRLISKAKNDIVKSALEATQRQIESVPTLEDYVCCFCEDGDLIGQWRGYTNRGKGYSISFDFNRLSRNLAQTALLNKIIYDRKVQLNILKDVFKIVIDHIDFRQANGRPCSDWNLNSLSENMRDAFHFWISRFKHPSYSEEREWRLVLHRYTNDDDEKRFPRPWGNNDLEFRAVGANLAPYDVIPFNEPRNVRKDYYPVKKIIIGPTHDRQLSEEGLKRFLAKLKRKSISVVHSKIPLRDI